MPDDIPLLRYGSYVDVTAYNSRSLPIYNAFYSMWPSSFSFHIIKEVSEQGGRASLASGVRRSACSQIQAAVSL